MTRILVVCRGNICRSPLAAAVLNQQGSGLLTARSAGLSAKWAGRPADPRMTAAATAAGYDLTAHRAAQVNHDLLQWAQMILAMDRAVLGALRELADATVAGPIDLYLPDAEVPDPFGKPPPAFAECVGTVVAGAALHVQRAESITNAAIRSAASGRP